MGGGKGSADSSGMAMAMASAQAAQEAYNLGEQQLQWTKDVWNQEQPLMDASEKQQMALAQQQQASLAQSQAESAQQWGQYQQLYAPLEATYVGQAENWASPQNIAVQRGQAMGAVGSAGQQQLNAAAEQLQGYGINPGSGRYASLFTSAQPLLGAAQAAAGTTAEQNLKLQQMGLESGAVNTGRGLVNAVQGLTGAGTSAGQAATGAAAGAAGTAQQNLATGSQAMTAPTAWFNAGANNMNSYVNAVNGYNQSQAEFAQAGASEMGGLGSALGSLTGMAWMGMHAKGGPIGFQDGGDVGGPSDPQFTPQQGGGQTGIPSQPVPPGGTPGGGIPPTASPSMGQQTDDVPAMLTANEFVIPKDVATWLGHKAFVQQIDKARKEQQQFSQRDDIGGEPTGAIPQQPTFTSRPAAGPGAATMGIPMRPMMGAIPSRPVAAMPAMA
jgi:hypothetical protein